MRTVPILHSKTKLLRYGVCLNFLSSKYGTETIRERIGPSIKPRLPSMDSSISSPLTLLSLLRDGTLLSRWLGFPTVEQARECLEFENILIREWRKRKFILLFNAGDEDAVTGALSQALIESNVARSGTIPMVYDIA